MSKISRKRQTQWLNQCKQFQTSSLFRRQLLTWLAAYKRHKNYKANESRHLGGLSLKVFWKALTSNFSIDWNEWTTFAEISRKILESQTTESTVVCQSVRSAEDGRVWCRGLNKGWCGRLLEYVCAPRCSWKLLTRVVIAFADRVGVPNWCIPSVEPPLHMSTLLYFQVEWWRLVCLLFLAYDQVQVLTFYTWKDAVQGQGRFGKSRDVIAAPLVY